MKLNPVIARAMANHDIDETLAHYLRESAEQVALGFIDALEAAHTHIARHPATGSPRCAHALDLPGLRCWSRTRYPQLVFYLERPDHMEVWRVLHGKRDITAWLADSDEAGF